MKSTEIINNFKELNSFAKKYLPDQGPLEYFVHHNTLHSFEEHSFYDALRFSSSMYSAKTKKSLKWYQAEFSKGRITKENLSYICNIKELDFEDRVVQDLLFYNKQILVGPRSVGYINFLNLFPENIKNIPNDYLPVNTFWNNIQKENEKNKIISEIDTLKSRFYSSYFDKGVAYWTMENRELGLLARFIQFSESLIGAGFKKYLKHKVSYIKEESISGEEKVMKLFSSLEVPALFEKNVYLKILLQNKGWAALVKSLEENPHYNPTKINSSFLEYTIIELIFEVSAYEYFKDKNKLIDFEYKYLEEEDQSHYKEYLFNILTKHSENIDKYALIDEDKLFEIWHEAYERNLILKTVSVLKNHRSKEKISPSPRKIQIVTCIDDREESLRRHFEEVDSDCETFGYAGHFGLNILYKASTSAHYRPLCPVSVKPEFYVTEKIPDKERIKKSNLGRLKHLFYHYSKSPFWGALLSFFVAPFSLILFFLDTFYPKKAHHIQQFLDELIAESSDEYELEYEDGNDQQRKGYKVSEMGDVIYSMLNTIGLNDNFAPIIYICGHGSESSNNPHEAAHDCGACSGGRGAPNAKLFSIIGNRVDVRDYIELTYGVKIPEKTIFVGGYHNTCNDDLLIFNKESIPIEDLKYMENLFLQVSALDAKERVRKFENVPLSINDKKSLEHVQARAHNLAQPRPEYGHATNGICIVGPRENNKDIFYDRRAFLVSYDQNNDSELTTLSSLVSSIVPVCAGINLEYYFSFVDREYFGSGVKQPHNITSLMGVMNGYRSDLRLGLPWQMVEIHEPVRIIIVIESNLQNFEKVLENNSSKKLIQNYWVRVIISDPSGKYFLYENDSYQEVSTDSISHASAKVIHTSSEVIKNTRDIIDFKNIG